MSMHDPQTIVGAILVAAAAVALLAPFLGLTRRTIVVAIGLAFGVNAYYPGGTAALVVDVLRPFHAFMQDEKDKTAARDASIGEVADGTATVPTR